MHISQFLYGGFKKVSTFFYFTGGCDHARLLSTILNIRKSPKKKFHHEVQTCWKKNTDTVCQKAEVHAFPADALMQDYILFTLPHLLINMQMFL